jgi:hypothetical protein
MGAAGLFAAPTGYVRFDITILEAIVDKPKKQEPRSKKTVPEPHPWNCRRGHPNSSPPPSKDFMPTCSYPGCDAKYPRSSSAGPERAP